jgi:8-oxo-dGTP pyrophosphatase MutT (NUDIX family)
MAFRYRDLAMPVSHPRHNDAGKPVVLKNPSTPTPLSCWADPTAIARVVPDGPLPEQLNGLALTPGSPQGSDEPTWRLTVPPLAVVPGKAPAAGAVVLEPEGRVWVIHPSNAFGGYRATFPKGKQEPGLSLEQTAIKETFEEAGLIITLSGWLIDVPRSSTVCRYFLARRIGGSPADMGWESQAVSLVPRDRLSDVLQHSNDQPLLEALRHGV